MNWHGAKDLLLHILWPQTCAHCREDLAQKATQPLCRRCRASLRPNEPPFCLRCANPIDAQALYCGPCAKNSGSCRLIRSAYLYEEAAVSLVHAIKYRGRQSAAIEGGRWMASSFSRFPELFQAQFLVPVPLHSGRFIERGYNQAELLAIGLSQLSGIPMDNLLKRVRSTKPQWKLNRKDRAQNIAGAFTALASAKGKRLLLIDDVCTSGSSLEACAEALLEAGAADVCGYTFAREA